MIKMACPTKESLPAMLLLIGPSGNIHMRLKGIDSLGLSKARRQVFRLACHDDPPYISCLYALWIRVQSRSNAEQPLQSLWRRQAAKSKENQRKRPTLDLEAISSIKVTEVMSQTFSLPPMPAQFAAQQAQGALQNQPVAQFEIGSYRNFVYMIIDWQTQQALIVDPQQDLSPLLSTLSKFELQLRGALLTHTHFDHVAGLQTLLQLFPKLPIHVHSLDLYRIQSNLPPGSVLELVQDNQFIRLGQTEIQILHTPGHSAGECCYFVPSTRPPFLLTGDTVFIRDCGRTDFPDGSDEQMFSSLQKVKRLPPETVILPGHHYQPECASTLARELIESPPFRCQTVQELARLA